MNPAISSMMEREVAAIDMDDTVADIERLFERRGLSWAPVLEAGRLVMGVISASDLLHFHAESRDPEQVRAWQMCRYQPLTVGPDTPVGEVARLMIESRLHHVVVTEHGQVVGVLSSLDFVRTFVPD